MLDNNSLYIAALLTGLVAATLLAIHCWGYTPDGEDKLLHNTFLYAVLLITPALASILWNGQQISQIDPQGVFAYILSILIFSTIGYFISQDQISSVMWNVSFLTTILLVVMIVFGVDRRDGRLGGLTGELHPNYIGLMAVTSGSLALGFRPLLATAIWSLSLWACIEASSRACILALCFAAVTVIFIEVYQSRFRYFGRYALFTSILIIICTALTFLTNFEVALDYIVNTILRINDSHRGATSGGTGRFDVWKALIDGWKESPVFGKGLFIFRNSFDVATDGGYVRTLAETGLVGVAGGLIFVVAATMNLASRFAYPILRSINYSQAGLFSAFFVVNFSDSRLQSCANPLSVMFYIIAFFLVSHRYQEE